MTSSVASTTFPDEADEASWRAAGWAAIEGSVAVSDRSVSPLVKSPYPYLPSPIPPFPIPPDPRLPTRSPLCPPQIFLMFNFPSIMTEIIIYQNLNRD